MHPELEWKMPQLRCVGSGCRVLTGWVSLLARCELTVELLAGPSRQVGCCGAHSEPRGSGASGAQRRTLTHLQSSRMNCCSITTALYRCAGFTGGQPNVLVLSFERTFQSSNSSLRKGNTPSMSSSSFFPVELRIIPNLEAV